LSSIFGLDPGTARQDRRAWPAAPMTGSLGSVRLLLGTVTSRRG
jgi:hypothetical protein